MRPFLEELDRDVLIELITHEMARDEALAARLHLRAALASSTPEDVRTLKRALDEATHFHDFLAYQEVSYRQERRRCR